MDVSYTVPLKRAWERMRAMLLRPFRLETWLVTGFSAFLSSLVYGGSAFSGSNWSDSYRHRSGLPPWDAAAHWLANPLILFALAGLLVAFALVALVLAYLGARAEFVFLDNVLAGRPAFVEPWKRAGRLGRSFFLWQAGLSFTWLVPAAIVGVPLLLQLRPAFAGDAVHLQWWALVPNLVLASLAGLVILFVAQVTCDFVVPLMRRHDETVLTAWRRFWPLFTTHLGDFVAFSLFLLVLVLLALFALVAAGLATCCVGLVLLAIPYVGTVLALPLYVTARAFGPEFLAQYGPEWDVFAAPAPAAEAPPAPPIA